MGATYPLNLLEPAFDQSLEITSHLLPQLGRDQLAEVLANQFLPPQSLEPASRRIDVQHGAVRVLNENRIGRALKQVAKALLAVPQLLLRSLALRYVIGHGQRSSAATEGNRAPPDLDVNQRPVFLLMPPHPRPPRTRGFGGRQQFVQVLDHRRHLFQEAEELRGGGRASLCLLQLRQAAQHPEMHPRDGRWRHNHFLDRGRLGRGGGMTYIEELSEAIRRLHGVEATHRESVPVKEVFQGKTIWEGIVEVFELHGHPKANIAYVWTHATDDPNVPKKSVAVLHI